MRKRFGSDSIYCTIECPYCGEQLEVDVDIDSGLWDDETCENCGGTYTMEISVEIDTTITKKAPPKSVGFKAHKIIEEADGELEKLYPRMIEGNPTTEEILAWRKAIRRLEEADEALNELGE